MSRYHPEVGGIAAWDLEWFRAIHIGLHRSWLDPVFWILSSSGLGYVQGVAMLSLLASRSTRSLFGPMLAMHVVSGLFSDVVKIWVPRMRPSNLPFAIPQESIYLGGFPSGHTTTSFGIAVLVFLTYRGTRRAWIGWIALIWAALVGCSRVYRGVHWPTDVLGGACLGACGAATTFLFMDRLGVVARLRAGGEATPPSSETSRTAAT